MHRAVAVITPVVGRVVAIVVLAAACVAPVIAQQVDPAPQPAAPAPAVPAAPATTQPDTAATPIVPVETAKPAAEAAQPAAAPDPAKPVPAAPTDPAKPSTAAPPEGVPPALPAEFSAEARKAYAAALKEARALVAQQEYALALNRLDALALERPREPQARFLKATILADQGKDDEAIAVLIALTGDFPELPEPHNNLAVLYGKKGQYEMARRELESAVATAPDYAIGHENLGDVYVRLAATQYEQSGELDKRSKTAPLKLKLVRETLALSLPPPEMGPPAPDPATRNVPASEAGAAGTARKTGFSRRAAASPRG
jgi:tetratricopeptide (TPR) repeat protein